MTLHIYQLTLLGKKLARSTSHPDNPTYRIIHFLDQQRQATTEQIAEFCGLNEGDTSVKLGSLRRRKVISEITGTEL